MKLTAWVLLACFSSSVAIADDLQLAGTVTQNLPAPTSSQHAFSVQSEQPQPITLLNIQLSDNAQRILKLRADKAMHPAQTLASPRISRHPSQVQRGMANVPVLNQGAHGACVTFAVTAAMDAALEKGDYISQLCQLQLGRYLENNAYIPSGWNGSLAEMVIHQTQLFGIVSKDQQALNGCGDVFVYPLAEAEPQTDMTPSQYHLISEQPNNVMWSPVLDMFHVALDKTDMANVLNTVKDALSKGDRLTFGVLLPAVEKGVAGAVGSHHALLDTWVLTPEIAAELNDAQELPGHEMVITGYDDNAMAIDLQGHVHKGLLTLRNSWSKFAGDKGDFYMTYAYFKTLAIEVHQIGVIPTPEPAA